MKLKFTKMEDMHRSYRATNITDVNPSYTGIVKAIEIFWVSRSTGWCVIRMDAQDYQFGRADYVYRKSEALEIANYYATHEQSMEETFDQPSGSRWFGTTREKF
jgi:hypothetical protein